MRSLTWEQVLAWRVARSHLDDRLSRDALSAVARDTCGIQAQVLPAAELCLGIRSEATQQDVREQLWEHRSLVKTYGLRSTLHLFAADEVALWMAAMRIPRLTPSPWYEAHGLDESQTTALVDAVRDALDGKRLTRVELGDAVATRMGRWAGDRLAAPWADLLDVASHSGVLCYGPSRGAKATFVRVDQWTGRSDEIAPEDAMPEVVKRYLSTYGPARHADFAQWFQMKPSIAKKWFQSVANELEEVDVEGTRLWMASGASGAELASAEDSVRLLPQYDCYVIGSRQRSRFIPEPARKRISAYGRGRFEGPVAVPLLVINGVVAGMWKRATRAGGQLVTVEPFTRLTKDHRRRLEAEAVRLGRFYGTDATLSIATLQGDHNRFSRSSSSRKGMP
jgi:hypothetical protein